MTSSVAVGSRRGFLRRAGTVALGVAASGGLLSACGDPGSAPSTGEAVPDPLRFGVGPFLPTPSDTKAAYEPFFARVADELGVGHAVTATDSWAGIAVALGSDQVDVAWMGPFGYVLANHRAGAQAVATVKYDDKPVYHAIIVGRPELVVERWPEDGKGRSISFAEVSSTSGWLIPTYWFRQRGIDPKTYFRYTEGAAHPANELAVASGRVDFATDYDRNRNAMIAAGGLAPDATKVVWTSDPLPNDAIAVRGSLAPAISRRLRDLLVAITPEQAKGFMPERYTGFVPATADSYRQITEAAVALDALKG